MQEDGFFNWLTPKKYLGPKGARPMQEDAFFNWLTPKKYLGPKGAHPTGGWPCQLVNT